MGFMAAAVPIAIQVLGALSKKDQPQQQPTGPAKPSLGEIFSSNQSNYQRSPFTGQSATTQPEQVGSVGQNIRGFNG